MRSPETKRQHYFEGLGLGTIGFSLAAASILIRQEHVGSIVLGLGLMLLAYKVATRPLANNS